MTWSFSVGSLLGSELRVHATFLLLLAWIGTVAWMADGPAAALVNIIFVLSLFACVVAHEFGHALMARKFGIKTPDITLLPIGGMARLERIPEKPSQEIAVALAGPAVNVVIWVILTIVFRVETSMDSLVSIDDMGQGFFERLAVVNLFLVVFNMIPAFPMDGGRVFRALLAMSLGRVRATQIAAFAGQSVAFLFGYFGLTTGNPLLLLIAVFVFLAAASESSSVMMHDLAKGYLARDAVITSFESLAPDASVDTAAQALLRTTQSEFPVVDAQGVLAGVLTKAAILVHAQSERSGVPVADLMQRDVPSVRLTDTLERVIDDLQKPEVPAVAVTDPRGTFVGYITRENLGEWAVLSRRPHS